MWTSSLYQAQYDHDIVLFGMITSHIDIEKRVYVSHLEVGGMEVHIISRSHVSKQNNNRVHGIYMSPENELVY